MSDEALNAHLHWLDKCAKEQGDDYETWLENRATQLEEELATLTNSLEMTWGVILQRNPSVGGHISYAAERGFEKLETALSIAMSENQRLTKYVEDYEEENAALKRWQRDAFEVFSNIDLDIERIRKIKALLKEQDDDLENG